MPKEYINDENYGREVRLDGSDGNAKTEVMTTAKLKLAWGRDTYVQAAIVTDDDVDGFEAQHISLNRYGINRLIRSLRKARDQAYGADA